jgi:hypothetical protein
MPYPSLLANGSIENQMRYPCNCCNPDSVNLNAASVYTIHKKDLECVICDLLTKSKARKKGRNYFF